MNANKLAAIESSSRNHASELLLLRSKVAEVETPIADLSNRLPALQDSVDNTAGLVVSHLGVVAHRIQENGQSIGQDLQRSHESMQLHFSKQQDTLGRLEELLEKLQRKNEPKQPKDNLVRRSVAKPAAFKELCDSIYMPEQSHSQNGSPDSQAHPLQNRDTAFFQSSRPIPTNWGVCMCYRPHRRTIKRGIRWGPLYLASEWESRGHWPSCPLSKTANKTRHAINLEYAGLVRVLESMIKVSFAWTSGAGGFSISPTFAYHPTVDAQSAPAFRILDLLAESFSKGRLRSVEPFIIACIRKLAMLFDDRKAHPTAITDRNESLMHYAAWAVSF